MKELSGKVAGIASSATLEIADTARRMQRDGVDVISLSIGEPDFDTPQHIKDACIAALLRGETHYAPSNGIPELLAAIAIKTTRENGFPCSQDQVIATAGGKGAIYEAMEAVVDRQDEVLLIDPCWVSYEPCIQLAGGRAVHHMINSVTYQLDDSLLEKISQKTRMIVVNTPSNPSGAVLDRKSLSLVADICTDYDLYALSDEIYEKLIYEREHISLASLGDMACRTITVNGFSKAYAMTGWRLGYAVAPVAIIRQMSKVQQHTISHPTSFVMYGGVAALNGDQGCVESMRNEFRRRRDFFAGALKEIGYELAPTDGAFYAFARVEGDDIEIARYWLSAGHVAVTPGSAFGTPGWLRLSYATSMEKLKLAISRIRQLRAGEVRR